MIFSRKNKFNQSGQALVELIIGLAIGVIIIGAATVSVVSVVNTGIKTKNSQASADLSLALVNNVRTFSESNWSALYSLNKGQVNKYYLSTSTPITALVGQESITISGVNYSRYFYVENVNRDAGGNIATIGTDDPLTQKITIVVSWPGNTQGVSVESYLTRSKRSFVFRQNDWSSGASQTGPVTDIGSAFASSTSNIDFNSVPGSLKMILP